MWDTALESWTGYVAIDLGCISSSAIGSSGAASLGLLSFNTASSPAGWHPDGGGSPHSTPYSTAACHRAGSTGLDDHDRGLMRLILFDVFGALVDWRSS